MIAAVSLNGVIGRDNGLPWHCPEDMSHFRQVTTGHVVVMGSGTWRSLGAKPLKNRVNIVFNRRHNGELLNWGDENPVHLARSISRTLLVAHRRSKAEIPGSDSLFVIGGAQTYAAFSDIADEVILSVMPFECEGDTMLPTMPWGAVEVGSLGLQNSVFTEGQMTAKRTPNFPADYFTIRHWKREDNGPCRPTPRQY